MEDARRKARAVFWLARRYKNRRSPANQIKQTLDYVPELLGRSNKNTAFGDRILKLGQRTETVSDFIWDIYRV